MQTAKEICEQGQYLGQFRVRDSIRVRVSFSLSFRVSIRLSAIQRFSFVKYRPRIFMCPHFTSLITTFQIYFDKTHSALQELQRMTVIITLGHQSQGVIQHGLVASRMTSQAHELSLEYGYYGKTFWSDHGQIYGHRFYRAFFACYAAATYYVRFGWREVSLLLMTKI